MLNTSHFKSAATALMCSLCALALSGCAVGTSYVRPALPVPQQWQAPLPTPPASTLATSAAAQSPWLDPVLVDLIAQAHRDSPSLAAAAARLDAAQATLNASRAGLWPEVPASATGVRTQAPDTQGLLSVPGGPVTTTLRNGSIAASWEIDLFGANRRAAEGAAARAQAMIANAQAAEITLSAEVASSYVNLRACEILVKALERDAASHQETLRLTRLKREAGFASPADAALAQASAAQAAARLVQQRAECDVNIKVLAELTTLPEPELRARLAASSAVFPQPREFAVPQIPAQALVTRPDLVNVERELAAAMADVGAAQADRYPRLSLTGFVGRTTTFVGGAQISGPTWSFGPSISLPLFDGGRRVAAVDSAQARYREAQARWRERALHAVREVEEALVQLDSARARQDSSAQALDGYQTYLDATQARVNAGAGNLMDLEEARRSVVAAQTSVVGVERERLAAWISLYRAVGSDWTHTASSERKDTPP